MDIEQLIKDLTLEEKARLLCGYANMKTYPVERLNIPSLVMSDGPNGLRIENSGDSLSGIAKTLPSTCFPSGVVLGQSWNQDLLYRVGIALGQEANHFGINVILGPAINIKRNPLGGRCFEYYSEDPLLAGRLASKIVSGIQEQHVGACLKHFACNNNETYRFVGDSIVDKRALREIYLKPFEIAVKESHPYAVMTAYNKINGTHCSENGLIQNEILRSEWGFDGYTVTDWGGIKDRDIALNNGCDLEMPGQVLHSVKLIIDGVKNGTIKEETLNASVRRILTTIDQTRTNQKECDFKKDYDLAVEAGLEGSVLLKNDDNLLPLSETQEYLIVGDFFTKMRYQGAGSALLNPYFLKTHQEAFDEHQVKYQFYKGYKEEETSVNKELEDEAIEACSKTNNTILFFGGLNDYTESEGFDRDNMLLQENQISILKRLVSLHKKIVFILHSGSQIEIPEVGHLQAILDLGLCGEGGGDISYQLLFGKVSPSGKLSETWVKHYDNIPFGKKFIQSPNEIYQESIYVGYRYQLSHPENIQFPFGFGLSYTSFKYENLKVTDEKDYVSLTYEITNTGSFSAKEISQIYVTHDSSLPHPVYELKGFDKSSLGAGETKKIMVRIPKDDLKIYDPFNEKWSLEDGTYTFMVGSTSEDIHLKEDIHLEGVEVVNQYSENVNKFYATALSVQDVSIEVFSELLGHVPEVYEVKKPYTMETPIKYLDSFFGRIFCNAVVGVGKNQYKKACKLPDGPEKEREKKAGTFITKMLPNNSIRSLCYSSSGSLKYQIAKGLIEMANGHFIKGIKEMTKKEKL